MRPTALILIAISLFAIIGMAGMANANIAQDSLGVNLNNWYVVGNPTPSISNGHVTLNYGGGATDYIEWKNNLSLVTFDYEIDLNAQNWNSADFVLYMWPGSFPYVQFNPYQTGNAKIYTSAGTVANAPFTNVSTLVGSNKWIHIKWLQNGTGDYLYINGTFIGYCPLSGGMPTSGNPYITNLMGNDVYFSNFYFNDAGIPYQGPTNSLYVNVSDANTQASISNAVVNLQYLNGTLIASGTTNATGWALLQVPQIAPHGIGDISNLTVSATGYSPAFQQGAWAFACSGGSYTTQAYMTQGAVSLYGYAYDNTDLSSLGGTTITIKYPNTTTMAAPVTDSSGYYQITLPGNAPSGTYTITATHTGFASNTSVTFNYPNSWGGNSGLRQDIYMSETIPTGKTQLVIRVYNKATNQTMPGATVQTYLTDYSATPTTYTTNSLGYVSAIVTQGTYEIKANAGSGYTIASGELVATTASTYTLILTLTPTTITTPTPYPPGTITLSANAYTPAAGGTSTLTLNTGIISTAYVGAIIYWQSYDTDGQGSPAMTFYQEYYQTGGTWYKGTPSGTHTATTSSEAFGPQITFAKQGIYKMNAQAYSTNLNPDGSNIFLGTTNTLTFNCGNIVTPTPGATVNPSMGPGATIYGGVRVYGSDTGTYVPNCNIQVISSGGTTAFYQQGIINGRATFFVTQNIVYTIMVDDPTGQYQARAITYVYMNQYDTATVYLYPNPLASPTPTATPTTSATVTFTGSVYTKYQNGTYTNLTTLYPGTIATITVVNSDGSGTVVGSGNTDITGHYSFTATITNLQGNDIWGNALVTMYYENVTAPNFQGSYVVFMAPVSGNARTKNFIIYPSSYGNVNGPNTDFTADVTTGALPLTVHFKDLSQNDPIAWYWDFGDGGTSTQQNPTHTYMLAGQYNVTLQSKNAYGMGNNEKYGYISTLGHIIFQGTVYNYNTNNVVNGALLTAIDSTGQGAATGYSDTNGHYSITATPPFGNVYSLRVSMTGFNGETITGLKYPTYFTNGVITNNIYIYPLSATTPQPCVSPGSPAGWATLSPGDRQSHITNSGNVIAAFAGLFAILIFLGGLAALVGRLRSG